MEITERPSSDYSRLDGQFIKAWVTFNEEFPVKFDVIINWDIDAQSYIFRRDSSGPIFLCGPEYVILSLDFDKKMIRKREYSASANSILIFMGGCDEFDFTSRILQEIRDNKLGRKITVILGAGYRNIAKLRSEFSALPGINFKCNVNNMFKEYMESDVAVSAGGIASYELIASRTPALLVATYEHQIKRCQYFHQMKWATYLGFRDFNRDEFLRGLENPAPVPYLDFGNMNKLISTIEELHERRYSKAR
jgi:spore coat polysaccharide biosynthesis predicted glycosyltransferase SpsG